MVASGVAKGIAELVLVKVGVGVVASGVTNGKSEHVYVRMEWER